MREPLLHLVSEVRDLRSLEALAPSWDALLEDSDADGIFCSPAWLLTWYRSLGRGAPLRVLVIRAVLRGPAPESSRLDGVLPLLEEESQGVRTLRVLGTGIVGSDYLGPVVRRGEEGPVARAIAEHLDKVNHIDSTVNTIDLLALEDLDRDDLAGEELQAALQGVFPHRRQRVTERFVCPGIPLGEAMVEGRAFPGAHFETTDPDLARQLVRKRAWLERRSGFSFEVETDPAALVHWERLHAARWAIEGGSAAVDGPSTSAFHRRVALALAAEGRFKLYLLRAEGSVVATIYAFERGRRAYFYQCGYDPSWGRRSVGSILLGMMVEETQKRGLETLDLLRGSEDYKFRFASSRRHTVSVAQGITARGDAAIVLDRSLVTVRDWIKRTLPERWHQPVREAVRRLRGDDRPAGNALGGA